ncbi:MAG: hypothetical protein AAGK74_05610, partial [Chloroflexota bacterium]
GTFLAPAWMTPSEWKERGANKLHVTVDGNYYLVEQKGRIVAALNIGVVERNIFKRAVTRLQGELRAGVRFENGTYVFHRRGTVVKRMTRIEVLAAAPDVLPRVDSDKVRVKTLALAVRRAVNYRYWKATEPKAAFRQEMKARQRREATRLTWYPFWLVDMSPPVAKPSAA